jgi:restriction system protein
MHFILVRSSRALIDKHQIGYGWAAVDFSAYGSSQELLELGFSGKNIGRKRKQILRYFNLQKSDIVVVPLAGTVAFAVVEGTKSHVLHSGIKYSENRVSVNYLTNSEGEVLYLPRKLLSTGLESRLKIRTSIASLDDFSDELSKVVSELKENKIYTVSKDISDKREQVASDFKEVLLYRLRSGEKIWIDAGGYGLEILVTEIFKANGYDANIQAKNSVKGLADVDVIATKPNILTGDLEGTLIQVKHHNGSTSLTGVRQLAAYTVDSGDYDYYRKVLVTTAELSDDVKAEAERLNIKTIDGEALVDWIYDNVDKLSEGTLRKLGIVSEPSLID